MFSIFVERSKTFSSVSKATIEVKIARRGDRDTDLSVFISKER